MIFRKRYNSIDSILFKKKNPQNLRKKNFRKIPDLLGQDQAALERLQKEEAGKTDAGGEGGLPWWEEDTIDLKLLRTCTGVSRTAIRGILSEHLRRLNNDFGCTQSSSSGAQSSFKSSGSSSSTTTSSASTTSSSLSKTKRGKIWKFVVGLVGKPSAGKSTFFNCVTESNRAECASHPFTTIEPNILPAWYWAGREGRDAKNQISKKNQMIPPSTKIPILVKDVAGLVPGAYEGVGKGNAFLNDLLDADCLVHVLDFSGGLDENGNRKEVEGDSEGDSAEISVETSKENSSFERKFSKFSNFPQVLKDIQFIHEELHCWIFNNVKCKWHSVRRICLSGIVGAGAGYSYGSIPSTLASQQALERFCDLFTGYHCTRSFVSKILLEVFANTTSYKSSNSSKSVGSSALNLEGAGGGPGAGAAGTEKNIPAGGGVESDFAHQLFSALDRQGFTDIPDHDDPNRGDEAREPNANRRDAGTTNSPDKFRNSPEADNSDNLNSDKSRVAVLDFHRWGPEELHRFIHCFICHRFPMLLACNKVDLLLVNNNLEGEKCQFTDDIEQPADTESLELLLNSHLKSSPLKSTHLKSTHLNNTHLNTQLSCISAVAKSCFMGLASVVPISGTQNWNIRNALGSGVELLDPIVVRFVSKQAEVEGPGQSLDNSTSSENSYLFARGSTVFDVYEALKNEGKIAGDFVRCEVYGEASSSSSSRKNINAAAAKDNMSLNDSGEFVWRVAKREEVLRGRYNVVRILTKKNAGWQKK